MSDCYKTNPRSPGNCGSKYGVRCKNGDIIEMILNLNTLCLSYKINEKNYGTAFKNIENTSYRAAITFFVNGEKVTLISYKAYN